MTSFVRRDGLAVYEHPGPPDAPRVVFVHGAMDRGAAFLPVTRRLTDVEVVRYDRRGYARSREAGVAHDIDAHVADLVTVLDGRPAAVVGHSLGGVIALAAAERRPDLVVGVGAFEAPTPWAPWWPGSSAGGHAISGPVDGPSAPGDVVERFMRRMIGDARWEGMPGATREARRSEGPALIADLTAVRGAPSFDLERIAGLGIPVVVGHGTRSRAHHVQAAAWVHERIDGSALVVVEGAAHDAHVSHAADVAAMVARVLDRSPA